MSGAAPHCLCPTCGAELHDEVQWDFERRVFIGGGVAVRFTPTRAKIIDAIWRERLRGGVQSVIQLMAMVYADDPDGGPLNDNVLSVHLHHIRRELAATGYTITMNMGMPRIGYRLAKLETIA